MKMMVEYVPSRGNYLLILKKANLKKTLMFPSPLVVSYFQMMNHLQSLKIQMYRFRPLSGYLISKCFRSRELIQKYSKSVSVPSRGILFPNGSYPVLHWQSEFYLIQIRC